MNRCRISSNGLLNFRCVPYHGFRPVKTAKASLTALVRRCLLSLITSLSERELREDSTVSVVCPLRHLAISFDDLRFTGVIVANRQLNLRHRREGDAIHFPPPVVEF